MKLPATNLYYLLAYAWNRLAEARSTRVGADDYASATDLLARVVIVATERLLRRGLDRGYVTRTEQVARLSGRVLFSEMARRPSFASPRLPCEVDELSVDVRHNQIIKATLRSILRCRRVDRALRHQAAGLVRELDLVSDVRPSRAEFSAVQLHTSNRYYAFTLEACRLLLEGLLPRDGGRGWSFWSLDEERGFGLLFEAFVRNFLAREQSEFQVSGWTLPSRMLPADASAAELLPQMEVDVRLERPGQTILVEVKATRHPLQQRFSRKTLRSDHLYQLQAYLRSARNRVDRGSRLDGILIYAKWGPDVDAMYELDGGSVRVVTLDLEQPWRAIHADLLGIVERSGRLRDVRRPAGAVTFS